MSKQNKPRFTVELRVDDIDQARWHEPDVETIRQFVVRIAARARHVSPDKIRDTTSLGHQGLSIAAAVMLRFYLPAMKFQTPFTVGQLIVDAERQDQKIRATVRESFWRSPAAMFRS